MIKPKYISILDIGSSSVIAFSSERNSNGELNIKASSEQPYEGYHHGMWYDKSSLTSAINKAFESVISKTSPRIKTIYVGVPGEFIKVVTKNVTLEYSQEHRVNNDDIDRLYAKGDTFDDQEWQLINSSAIYYILDGGKKIIDPRNCVITSDIELFASYILCKTSFVDDLQAILDSRADNVKFICSDWAQAISLIDADKRDQGVLVCDIGYISSSIMFARGDGLVEHSAFSNGGGYIDADLSTCLEIPLKMALTLKQTLDLNLACRDDDELNITSSKGSNLKAEFVNNVVTARIEDICDNVKDAIDHFTYKCPPYLKIYLTGGGLTDIRGASRIFSEYLDRAVEVLAPTLPSLNKPRYSSSVGIMEVVARWEQNKISFIKRFFARR